VREEIVMRGSNPLLEAYELHERLLELEVYVAFLILGDHADFSRLHHNKADAFHKLILDAWVACGGCSPRVRKARLNAIWKDFVTKHKSAAA
jgi:hypothetical protein